MPDSRRLLQREPKLLPGSFRAGDPRSFQRPWSPDQRPFAPPAGARPPAVALADFRGVLLVFAAILVASSAKILLFSARPRDRPPPAGP